ncbi:S9 family peptidase [Arachidicoccus soli]|uniref:S9 family peptidase n=1 Tax=Arachidicoccus soli TaxID=2341117 RepID=A0A386HPK6_9BACT|nr:DPP IV N-terminal domain-containing protein [Arachidicoccus soli]AYD47516.1 S9 family peptidase [Arachidicoccus soli]
MKKLCMLLLIVASAIQLQAQNVEKANYDLAAKFSPNRQQKMIFTLKVSPHWLKNGNRFWYQFETTNGKKWYLVDCDNRTKKPLFDEQKVIAKVSEIVEEPFSPQHFPIDSLQFLEDQNAIRFQIKSTKDELIKDTSTHKKGEKQKTKKKVYYFQFDIGNNTLTELKEFNRPLPNQRWASISPDRQTIIFVKHYNLYWMDKANYDKALKDDKDSSIIEHAITTDGELYYTYGGNPSNIGTDNVEMEKNKDKRSRPYIFWSPDSKHFALIREDQRKVKDLWVVHNMEEPRPTLETYKYAMPGDTSMPQDHLLIFDVANKSHLEIDASAYKDQTLNIQNKPFLATARDEEYTPLIWSGDNSHFYVTRQDRPMKRIDMLDVNINSLKVKSIIQERMNSSLEAQDLGVIDGGKELIEWSERSGWAQFYLYKGDGSFEHAITQGDFHCNSIEKIDEKNRVLYFTANGKEGGENPYYMHFYRVNLDGSGLKLLNKGDFDHAISMNDNEQFFIDNYSRVNSVPQSALYDGSGNRIMLLETADLSAYFAAGYKFPQPFSVKAADGITDLYGVLYKPFDFDSTKKYPLVEYVYPGPQTEVVNTSFTPVNDRTDRLAQIGLIVITVGNRGGSPMRSKWYHNFGYGNLRDYGLADKKTAAEEIADRFKFIDLDKLGIYGHSGGGFMTAAAMFTYPDFFKVGVSSSGNHDNRIYNSWWSEKHHGIQEKISEKGDTTFEFKIATNPEIAKNLKGHLLLSTGGIDDNVHPANTFRVADALIKANKRFDLVFLPNQRHHYGDMQEYFFWRLADYFSDWLIGDFSHSNQVDMVEAQKDLPKED